MTLLSTKTLYLIPNRLTEGGPEDVLPPGVKSALKDLDTVWVENPKPARAWLKELALAKPIQALTLNPIPETPEACINALKSLPEGAISGVISDAGCPGIADPGARLVRAAHDLGLRVRPLVGPSSIVLALMASGLQGQRFAFHGYLPVEAAARQKAIQALEKRSAQNDETQLVIETPYRNQALWESLVAHLRPNTDLTVAADLTAEAEWVQTHTVAQWRKAPAPNLHRIPAVFAWLAR